MNVHLLYLKHKSTLNDLFWRVLQVASQQGMILFLFILCAHLLSPTEFGLYNYTLAIVLFLVMFGDFGISLASSKYVAEYNSVDKEKVRAIPFNAGTIILILGTVISILAFIFGPIYFKSYFNLVEYVLPLIFLSPLVSLLRRYISRFAAIPITSNQINSCCMYFLRQ